MPKNSLTWRNPRPAEGFYTSEVMPPRCLPVRTFLPTGYEPNYPYPLLVFFHGRGSSEEQVLRLAPQVSRRNYVCISLRDLDQFADPGAWQGQADALMEDYVLRAVERTRRDYHIHSERIYLAGFCEGATLAYRLGFALAGKVAGVIALNGTLPQADGPLFRLQEVRQLRVLIGHGIANSVVPLGMARRDFRLLYTAGLNVQLKTYPTTHRLHADMLQDVNRWVMGHVNEEYEQFE
jgi:phospholipase/carboxylesterase